LIVGAGIGIPVPDSRLQIQELIMSNVQRCRLFFRAYGWLAAACSFAVTGALLLALAGGPLGNVASADSGPNCGTYTIDTATQGCCSGVPYSLADEGCCGGAVYDTAVYSCCGDRDDGEVYDPAENEACCSASSDTHEVYDTDDECCCIVNNGGVYEIYIVDKQPAEAP
jgi:hypothetical protein